MRNIEKKEIRRTLGEGLAQLLAQAGINRRNSDKQGNAQPDRQHQNGRECPRAVDVGERQPHHGCVRARACLGQFHQGKTDYTQHKKNNGNDHNRPQSQLVVIGCENSGGTQGGQCGKGHGDIAFARPFFKRDDAVTKQRGHRHIMGAAQWQQCKGQDSQQAISQPQCDQGRMKIRFERHGEPRAAKCCQCPWHRHAKTQPDHGADEPHDHDLQKGEHKGLRAVRTKRLHDGKGFAASLDKACGGIGDTDAADDQSGQADQRQELCEAFQIAPKLRGRIATRADFKRSLWKALRDGDRNLVQCRVGRIV